MKLKHFQLTGSNELSLSQTMLTYIEEGPRIPSLSIGAIKTKSFVFFSIWIGALRSCSLNFSFIVPVGDGSPFILS